MYRAFQNKRGLKKSEYKMGGGKKACFPLPIPSVTLPSPETTQSPVCSVSFERDLSLKAFTGETHCPAFCFVH